MRTGLLLLPLLLAPTPRAAPQKDLLKVSNLPDFVAQYQHRLVSIGTACGELGTEKLPLRDRAGKDLGKEPAEHCRASVDDARQSARQLASLPRDMVWALTLYIQTEDLADDLYDLEQMAYDSGFEDTGRRLGELLEPLESDRDRLENYLLNLISERQEYLRQLEARNRDLAKEVLRLSKHAPGKPGHEGVK